MLSHMPGHIGVLGNEIADKYAKLATKLPNNPTQIAREPWDIMVQGEKVGGPHKTWGRVHIPTHQQKNVHSLSFNPINRGDFRWIKWLYAMRYVPGYANPRSYWNYAGRGGDLCDNCDEYHNLSVHGHIGYCIPSSPWVKAWGKAWGDMQHAVMRWSMTATFRDKF